MTTGGSGIGGTGGNTPQLSIREIETTASVDVAKAAMRIVIDTLEVSLLVIDQDVRKYQSSAKDPVLKSLMNELTKIGFSEPTDESWRSLRNEMLNLMPKDFRMLFEFTLLLPKEQQNKDFILLDNTLNTAAKLMSWLSAASVPVAEDSPAALRAEANLLLPYVALNSSVHDSLLLFGQVQAYLELVGPNDPNFDSISGYMGAFAPLVEDLKVAMEQLQAPTTELLGRFALATIADKISLLADNYDRLYSGNELRMLGNLLHAVETAAQALSLSQPGSAALLLVLSQASLRIRNHESALGVIGNSYSAIVDAFKKGMDQITEGRISSGSLNLYNHLATTIFTTIAMLGALNYESISSTANPPTPESISEKNFGYGLLVKLLENSSGLSTLSSLVSNAADIKGKDAESSTALLTTMSLLFLISASVKGHSLSSTEPLIKSQGKALKEGIAAASALVSAGLLAGTLPGDTAEHLNVYLKQASIALEQENEEGFLAALDSSIELTGASSTAVTNDLNELKTTAHTIQKGLVVSGEEASSRTGIHIVA